jgi:hypothetical protein
MSDEDFFSFYPRGADPTVPPTWSVSILCGTMGPGTDQEIRRYSDPAEADAAAERLNADDRNNHPDLYYWVEHFTSDPDTGEPDESDDPCGYCGDSQDPNDLCWACWSVLSGSSEEPDPQPEPRDPDAPVHKDICAAYWDRGLECGCMSAETKRALRAGARPEDVL